MMILGIDEVGRGAWAGPLVVGAVVLGGAQIPGLTDSKALSKRARDRLSGDIRRSAAGVGLGWVSAPMIDKIGLGPALRLAARRAVADVAASYDEIIIDGTVRLVEGDSVSVLKKADLLIPAVSAASIVAKVARDAYMARCDSVVTGYRFASHVGYGTAAHAAALEEHGVSVLHRRSFAPVAALLEGPVKQGLSTREKREKTVGARAEDAAADYLEALGHIVIARNWRTPRCEIDIVSRFRDVTYFTEVKYRRQPNQGGGLAAITPAKLARMRYAGEVYAKHEGALERERRLSVVALDGEPPAVRQYLESV